MYIYLKHNVAEIVFVTVERLQQLQRFAVQQEQRIPFGEDQLQRDLGERIADDGQFGGRGALADIWRCENSIMKYIDECVCVCVVLYI